MATRSFKLHKDYWDCGNLYKLCTHTFSSGVITVLVGCNGSGKSTTIKQIRAQLRDNDEAYFAFDNVVNGGSSLYGGLLEGWNPGGVEAIASLACSSEGEKIHQNIMIKAAGRLGKAIEKACNTEYKELFLLWDAVDSGSSIDNIIELKDFFKMIIEDQKKRNNLDVYVIVSANSYEMANGEICYDMNHNRYIQFKSYDDYKKYIMRSRQFKDRRLKKWYDKQQEQEDRKDGEEDESSNHCGSRRIKGWPTR